MNQRAKSPPSFPPGWFVFQCKAGTKQPKRKGYALEASNDPAQIATWHAEDPDANWAVHMGRSNLAVVDVDPPIGEDSLLAFELEHGFLPPTREHRSARGGRHILLSDPEHRLKNSVGALGPKLDTRGGLGNKTGYILIPPSTFEGGTYTVTQDNPLAPVPDFVVTAAGKDHHGVAADKNVPLDTELAKTRAKALLDSYNKSGHVAEQGNGGDALTYAVAAEVISLGLSPDGAFEVMEAWNEHCQPPWDIDELRAKIENASRYAQNDAGAYAVEPAEQRIPAEALDKLKAESLASVPLPPAKKPDGLLPSFMGGEIGMITPPRWLVTPIIPTPSVGLVFGQFGSFKTTSTLDVLDAVLLGSAAFGRFIAEKGDAVLVAGEGLSGLKTRIEARALTHASALEDYPLLLVAKVPRVDHPDEWVALVKTIEARGLKPKLIVIDHLSIMLSGQDQNDATVATQAMQLAHELAVYFACTIIVLAHAGKDGDRQVRGSSAFLDNVDFAYELTRSDDSPIVKVRCAKMRDGEAPEPFYLKSETRHGAAILTYANADDARRASGKAVGLRPGDVSAALVAMGACPRGANEWNGSTGGISTKTLATEIATARHRGDGDGLDPSPREIDVLVMSLNRGAQDSGPFGAYVVREKPRQWAVAPGPVSAGANHE